MGFCTSCGHELGVGRFCTNCGQPVDRTTSRPARPEHTLGPGDPTSPPSPLGPVGPTSPPDPTSRPDASDTAERRAARRHAALEPMPPRTPPAAADTPRAPRYPLFADEVGGVGGVGEDGTTATGTHRLDLGGAGSASPSLLERLTTVPAAAEEGPRGPAGRDESDSGEDRGHEWGADRGEPEETPGRRRRPLAVLLLLLLVAAVLVAAVLGWRAVGGGSSDDSGAGSGDTASDVTGDLAGSGTSPETRDLSAEATATVPGNAPPATEVGGGRATFVAAHLLDGDPGTAWRVAGSAEGEEIVLRLPAAASISQVGLVNGYAKRATDADGTRFDWYHGNRRVTAVTWVLDDATEVDQDLTKDRKLQLVDVGPVTTDVVTLRLRTVSEPGRGRAGRDFTAISDVALIGAPAS